MKPYVITVSQDLPCEFPRATPVASTPRVKPDGGVITLGKLKPGDLFEAVEGTPYGRHGVVTDGGAGHESEAVFCEGRPGIRRYLPDSTPVRQVPWPGEPIVPDDKTLFEPSISDVRRNGDYVYCRYKPNLDPMSLVSAVRQMKHKLLRTCVPGDGLPFTLHIDDREWMEVLRSPWPLGGGTTVSQLCSMPNLLIVPLPHTGNRELELGFVLGKAS